jgi:hypothetical protein
MAPEKRVWNDITEREPGVRSFDDIGCHCGTFLQLREGLGARAAAAGVQVVTAPGLFPTPPKLATRMAALAKIEPGHRVLEPSAGTGNLVRAVCVDWRAARKAPGRSFKRPVLTLVVFQTRPAIPLMQRRGESRTAERACAEPEAEPREAAEGIPAGAAVRRFLGDGGRRRPPALGWPSPYSKASRPRRQVPSASAPARHPGLSSLS